MVMGSMAAAKAAQEAKAAGDEETFAAKMAESNEIRKQHTPSCTTTCSTL